MLIKNSKKTKITGDITFMDKNTKSSEDVNYPQFGLKDYTFLSKSQYFFSCKQCILQFIWKGIGPGITETVLKKKNNIRETNLTDVKT